MILSPNELNIDFAVQALRDGDLVGMPTETVYGIAANALDETAVKKIYELKGRPKENPLIVHVSGLDMAKSLTKSWPDIYISLAETFWPGPLTLIAPKSSLVPDIVTGSHSSVAIRMPRHAVAKNLISGSGLPLAAPSANQFMSLSPTRAEDIAPEIANGLACIVDGGACEIGIESTVIRFENGALEVLRPGDILAKDLKEAANGMQIVFKSNNNAQHDSPGQYRRHYAPKAKLILVEKIGGDAPGLVLGSHVSEGQISMPLDPRGYARCLYQAMRRLDLAGCQIIEVEVPPKSPEWAAIWDRLEKASHQEDEFSSLSTS